MNPYHETDRGQLFLGDCLDILGQLPENSINLTVTSPPYDNLRDYNGYSFDFEGIAKELFRITKQGGVVVWVVGDSTINGSETGTSFKQALFFKEIGFNLHDTMIYVKDAISFPDANRYQNQFEYIFVLSKDKPNTFNAIKTQTYYHSNVITDRQKDGKTKAKLVTCENKQRICGNVWRYQVGFMKSAKKAFIFEHPAIFPEQLAVDNILSWSNEGDLVLDPFLGSGTTATMALRYKRKYIGIEISEEYLQIAARRIDTELDQTDIFRDGKGI